MNKIIIAIASIAMTCSLHAASVSWSITAKTDYVDYNVYIATANTFASLSDLTKNLLGTSGNTGVLAKATATARNATASGGANGLTGETSYDFYYVFVNGDDYWVSSKQSVTTGAETASPATVTFSATNTNALLAGDKSGSFAVPEPTSGLLLLLGMAGLALKRKRA